MDLRKCGFAPVAGLLQTSGIVHHMTLDGVVDPSTGLLLELDGAQPTLAGVCGGAGSCHMWRDGGALQQLVAGEGIIGGVQNLAELAEPESRESG